VFDDSAKAHVSVCSGRRQPLCDGSVRNAARVAIDSRIPHFSLMPRSSVMPKTSATYRPAAPTLEAALPTITQASRHSVVILRLRGRSDLGTTFMGVLKRYATALAAVDSKLVVVSASERVQEQLVVTGITAMIGDENIYTGDERVGATLKRAHADAVQWIETQRGDSNDRPL
jgi:anti-anti-sigma regulatory factor